MDLDQIRDEVQRIDFTLSGDERIDGHRQAADRLEPGTPGRSWFLEPLVESLVEAERFDEARAALADLEADGGDTVFDLAAIRLDIELAAGDDEQAELVLADLLRRARADTLPLDDYAYVGEALEEAGRLRQALRWFTMPIRDADMDDLDQTAIMCLHGRFRVRRALEMPLDAFDEVSEAMQKAFGDDDLA